MPLRFVAYLTGAPGVGKTTASSLLATRMNARVFSYGAELTESLKAVDDQSELRRRSAEVIDPSHVRDIDARLARIVKSNAVSPVLIDSHAVTKEAYGFRAIPYDIDTISGLGVTVILCLYARVEVMIERISARPDGRPVPNRFDCSTHTNLQCSLAISYAHTLGVPVHFVDASNLVNYGRRCARKDTIEVCGEGGIRDVVSIIKTIHVEPS